MENKEKGREPNLIVFCRQSFTPLQKDIFTLGVGCLDAGINVQPELFEKNKTVAITAKMLGIVSGKNYQRLKEECREMTQKVLEISNDEKQEFEFIVPFPRIKYKKGVIELTMFADVLKSFLELKNGFTEYYIKEMLSLEHFNKKRLYEMLSAFKKRNIPTWKVYDERIKFYLGMQPNDYKGRPKQFGKNIIDICVNAINEKTSLKVSHERGKDLEGWFTVFHVAEKPKAIESKPAEMDAKSQQCYNQCMELGIKRKDILKKIVTEHQKDFFQWYSKNQSDIRNGKMTNPAGVFLVHVGLAEAKAK